MKEKPAATLAYNRDESQMSTGVHFSPVILPVSELLCRPHYSPLSRRITQLNKASRHVSRNPNINAEPLQPLNEVHDA